jgi:hypothetical protein
MMPSIKPQVLAAVTGAISAYLADEEASQAAALSGAGAGYAPGPPLNLWGLSGRSQAMQLRMLAQRRSLR